MQEPTAMLYSGWRGTLLFCLALVLCGAPRLVAQNASDTLDTDRDGLSDAYEQAVLEKFRPTFVIDADDCAERPARFAAGREEPELASADGTIYGQVFPVAGGLVEVHYYTLWSRDCGRNSHALDAEHVAVLVSKADGPDMRALYWYAGAHENTVCDISSGARAEVVSAEGRGAKVWSSSGKHALYLKKEMCDHGCGADSCENAIELEQAGPIINVGELSAPANGSLWTASPKWPLSEKMDSDFTPEVRATLAASSGDTVITLRGRSPVRGTLRRGDAVLNGATVGGEHTGAALDAADDNASAGLDKAANSTGGALKRAWKAVFGRKRADGQQQ